MITIVILLILAGISIASLTGNGIFEKAKLAKEKQENAQIEEDTRLEDYENNIDEYLSSTRNELNLDMFKKYKEIYTSGMIENNQIVEYTLEKSYPILVAVVSGIGEKSGTEIAKSGISIRNSSEELIKLIDNECAPYSSGKYYSTLAMAYIVNPSIGTTFTCEINYRGTVHIYALGDTTDSN